MNGNPVTVEVKLVGLVASLGGCSEMRLDVPAGTPLPRFMELLAQSLGLDFANLVQDQKGAIYAGIMIVCDGAVIPPRLLAAYRLDSGCFLKIMPVVSGG